MKLHLASCEDVIETIDRVSLAWALQRHREAPSALTRARVREKVRTLRQTRRRLFLAGCRAEGGPKGLRMETGDGQ